MRPVDATAHHIIVRTKGPTPSAKRRLVTLGSLGPE
jgi:hypothetical protein